MTLWWHKFTLQPQVWYFSSRSHKTSLCIGFGSKPTEQILRRSLNWKNLFRNPLYLSTQPLSHGTKELVKNRQDKGIWEQVGLIELANLNPNVGAHVQVDVAAAVQETFTFTQASFEVDYQKRYSQLQLLTWIPVISDYFPFYQG